MSQRPRSGKHGDLPSRRRPVVGDVRGQITALSLWSHLFGEHRGLIGLFSGVRSEPGLKQLGNTRAAYFAWPEERERARACAEREAAAGRETYFCAHLLRGRRRVKENAAPIVALYVDGDGASVPEHLPPPSATVQSSPGREQFYWRLVRAIAPEVGEMLNRRLALAMGADPSGWDLSQLLRVPGTPNLKYAGTPIVRIREIRDDLRYEPRDLERALPPLPPGRAQQVCRVSRPENPGPAPDLSRLSRRMQDLILCGNRGEYGSRSEADMAACLALFGASYTQDEVWEVMTNPANSISEKFIEKGRHGERYLELTISKAQAIANAGRRRIYVGPPKSDVAVRRKVVVRGG